MLLSTLYLKIYPTTLSITISLINTICIYKFEYYYQFYIVYIDTPHIYIYIYTYIHT